MRLTEKMKTYQAYKITISIWDGKGIYEVNGALLEDWRLLTYHTGPSQGDELWRSIVAYEPNGGDRYQAAILGELTNVPMEIVAKAYAEHGEELFTAVEIEYLANLKKGEGE